MLQVNGVVSLFTSADMLLVKVLWSVAPCSVSLGGEECLPQRSVMLVLRARDHDETWQEGDVGSRWLNHGPLRMHLNLAFRIMDSGDSVLYLN